MKPVVKPSGMTLKDRSSTMSKPRTVRQNLYDALQEIQKNITSSNIAKPTNVEAQRILKILDELLQIADILSYLDTDFIAHFMDPENSTLNQEQVKNLSQITLNLLKKQAFIENKYTELTTPEQEASLHNKDENQTSDQFEEDQEIDPEEKARLEQEKKDREEKRRQEAEKVSKLLVDNLQTILREIKKNEQDFVIIKLLRKNPLTTDMQDILLCVNSLRIIMLKKLSTAAEEEDSHVKMLQELKERISSLEKSKNVCEVELEKLKNERSRFSNEKKEEIENLKKQLEEVKSNKKKEMDKLEKSKKDSTENLDKKHMEKEQKLVGDLTQQQSILKKLKDDHEKEEADMKRRKVTSEGLLNDNIAQYDALREQWAKDSQQMQNEHNAILKELKDLQEHFKNVDAERKREEILEKEWQDRLKQYDILQKKKGEAARHIQIAFRAYKAKSKKKGKMGKMGKKK